MAAKSKTLAARARNQVNAYIKTLVDGKGNQILPRTRAKAVMTEGGVTAEEKFAEIAGELGGISSTAAKARPNIIGTYPVAAGQTISAGDVVDVQADGSVGKTIGKVAADKTAFMTSASYSFSSKRLSPQYTAVSYWCNGARAALVDNNTGKVLTTIMLYQSTSRFTDYTDITVLSETQFVVSYRRDGFVRFFIIERTGETITNTGNEITLSAVSQKYDVSSVTIPISASSFYLFTNIGGLNGIRCTLPTSASITFEAPVSLPGVSVVQGLSAVELPDQGQNKRVCICFCDNSAGQMAGKAVIAAIDRSNALTFGSAAALPGNPSTMNGCAPSCAANDSSILAVLWINSKAMLYKMGFDLSSKATLLSARLDVSSHYAMTVMDNRFVVGDNCIVELIDDSGQTIEEGDTYLFGSGVADPSLACLSESKLLLLFGDNSNNTYATSILLEVFEKRISGSFVDESSQCIALQSGESGREVEVIFDGVAELPGAVKGQEIVSSGVYGYCPKDGWLWVRPEWDGAVCGSYTGVGSTLNRKIELGFTPSAVIVCCERQNNDFVGNFPVGVVHKGGAVYYSTIKVLEITEGGFVVGSNGAAAGSAFNTEGLIYNYIALR